MVAKGERRATQKATIKNGKNSESEQLAVSSALLELIQTHDECAMQQIILECTEWNLPHASISATADL